MKLGVLNDFAPGQRGGGANRAIELFLLAKPADIELVLITPGGLEASLQEQVDGYILFLTKSFSDKELGYIQSQPYVWCGFDWWPDEDGRSRWRNLITENARAAIFVSPLHLSRFCTLYAAQPPTARVMPPPLDLDKLVAPQEHSIDRAAWASEWHPYKAPDLAAVIARRLEMHMDMFSPSMPQSIARQSEVFTPFAHPVGFVPEEKWYETLGRYKYLIHTPRIPDAFGYVMLEAYALGLEVIVGGRTGVESYEMDWSKLLEWCGRSPQDFWHVVEGSL